MLSKIFDSFKNDKIKGKIVSKDNNTIEHFDHDKFSMNLSSNRSAPKYWWLVVNEFYLIVLVQCDTNQLDVWRLETVTNTWYKINTYSDKNM